MATIPTIFCVCERIIEKKSLPMPKKRHMGFYNESATLTIFSWSTNTVLKLFYTKILGIILSNYIC